MKHFFVLLLLLMLFSIFGLILWDITANSAKFLSAHIYPYFIKNKLTLDYGTLDTNDFKIYFSGHDGGYDGKLGYNHMPIYKAKNIPFVYGENDWVITYKGQQQCKFRHFKTNRRYTHNYKFAIYEKQDTLYCDINIRGKNSMKQTFYFTAIDKDNVK